MASGEGEQTLPALQCGRCCAEAGGLGSSARCICGPNVPCGWCERKRCSGAGNCSALLHEHGCFADHGGAPCTAPSEHAEKAAVRARAEALERALGDDPMALPFGEFVRRVNSVYSPTKPAGGGERG